MRLYAVSRDGTLDGLEWRVGLPLIRTTPEAALKERDRATADTKVSAGWRIIEVELEVTAIMVFEGRPEGGAK
jgi:hypothetical protein